MTTPLLLPFSSTGTRARLRRAVLMCVLAGAGLWMHARAQTDEFDVPGLDAPAAGTPEARDTREADDPDEGTTLFGLVRAGGWAMWILGALSVSVLSLAVYLFTEFRKPKFAPGDLEAGLGERMERLDLEGALRETEAHPSVLARTMNEGLHLIFERGYEVLGTDSLPDTMREASIKCNRHRAKLVNYFGTIAQAAPMVGLLGTVSGMIKAFGKLGQEGMGDPSGLAANISEALVTTASGLIIAIPSIFFYSYFRDKLQDLITRTDDTAAELMKQLKYALHRHTDDET